MWSAYTYSDRNTLQQCVTCNNSLFRQLNRSLFSYNEILASRLLRRRIVPFNISALANSEPPSPMMISLRWDSLLLLFCGKYRFSQRRANCKFVLWNDRHPVLTYTSRQWRICTGSTLPKISGGQDAVWTLYMREIGFRGHSLPLVVTSSTRAPNRSAAAPEGFFGYELAREQCKRYSSLL